MPPWWHNKRGELFVLAQFVLIGLLLFAPRDWVPPGAASSSRFALAAGLLLLAGGGVLALAATVSLGRNLSPLISPRSGSVLIEHGVYRLVRHPIYSGLILGAAGLTLLRGGRLTLLYALLLTLLLDRKASCVEVLLLAHFPGYADYRRRVRKLIPFLY